MSLFAIADLHLSLGTDKPMDVFHGWENYTERLQKNWVSFIKPEDTVVIAGDISWAMNLQDTKADFTYLNQLPGTKLILKGNHDYWWSTRRKMESFLAENGFSTLKIIHNSAELVGDIAVFGSRGWLYNAETPEDQKVINREVGRLKTSLDEAKKLGGTPIAFLHYPPVYDGNECTEILDVLLENHIKECYFGHIHGNQAMRRAITGDYKGIQMHLISCDYLKFCPILVR